MSFNRPSYDICSYKQTLAESIGPGDYQINKPVVSCNPCFPNDPHIRAQRIGASISKSTAMIDIDSELSGIGRKYSRCPENRYLPTCDSSQSCGANTGIGGNKCNSKICIDYDLIHFGDCFTPTEDTRLSNPPCTLRGTGWNRWEWLPANPQERVTIPFDFNIDTVQVAKDNHRPCIPRPLNQFSVHPENNNLPIKHTVVRTCGVPLGPPSVHWKPVSDMYNYTC